MPNQAGIDYYNGANAEILASKYSSFDRKQIHRNLFDKLEEATTNGKNLTVLDIGSGSGDDAYEMAKLGHNVVAIEPSELHHIAIRDHSHQNIDYRNGQLPSLTTIKASESFDVIMMSTVWQYIDPQERVDSLVKIAQHLKPNGSLYISYPSPPTREHQFEITEDMLTSDILTANQFLPKGKKLSISVQATISPDSAGRKSLDGQDVNFYSFSIENGHSKSLEKRSGWTR